MPRNLTMTSASFGTIVTIGSPTLITNYQNAYLTLSACFRIIWKMHNTVAMPNMEVVIV